MTKFEEVLYFATIAHQDQYRKDNITPYIAHPIAVSNLLTLEEDKILALLHDVIEDTDARVHSAYTIEYKDLKLDLNYDLIKDLTLLTHERNASYEEYITGISTSKRATRVKLGDIYHNLAGEPTPKQLIKYRKGLSILLASL